MNLKQLLFPVFLVAIGFNASGQASWQILPDTGIAKGVGGVRYEDVFFTDSTTGFAVTLKGFIFKTNDAGRNWKIKNIDDPAALRSIEFLADKRTGMAGSLDVSPSHFLRTTDGGETWTDIAGTIKDSTGSSSPTGVICGLAHWGDAFYAVGSWSSKVAKLYMSFDKGASWIVRAFDTALISGAVDVVFTSADTGFVTGGYRAGSGMQSEKSVVLKTTDGGLSWRRVFSDITIGGRIWKIQAITPQLLVGSIEPYYKDTVAMIRSTNGGESWTIIGSGFSRAKTPSNYGTQGIGFINAQHGWLGGYYPGIFETKDGGVHWDTLNFGANFNRMHVLDSAHVFAGGADIYFYGNSLPTPPPSTGVPASVALPHFLYPVVPNPAQGRVKIEFDILEPTTVLLQVASIDAKQSWQVASGIFGKGHYVYYWDGRAAPAGNYMVWLGTNEIPIVQKFTLQH